MVNNFVGFMASISSGVIVSIVTLWLAGRQRTKEERLAEQRRREAILAGIGRELQWNRTAIKDLEIGNAHYMIGDLKTVAFERYGAELATMRPKAWILYSSITPPSPGSGRACAYWQGCPLGEINERSLMLLIGLLNSAGPAVSNSATAALKSLGIIA